MLTAESWMPRSAKPELSGPPCDFTPGVSSTSASTFRPLSGKSVMRLFSTTFPIVALEVSTKAASPRTSIDSAVAPTCSWKLMFAC